MREEIRGVIATALNMKESQLTDSKRIEDVAADSIELIGVIAALTEHFKTSIDALMLNDTETVGQALNILEKMLIKKHRSTATDLKF